MYRKLRLVPSVGNTALSIALICSLLLHSACSVDEEDFQYCGLHDTERCPEDYVRTIWNWECLAGVFECAYGKQLHCARHYTNRSKMIFGCAESKECLPGEAPYLDKIERGKPTDEFHITCADCHDKEHFNDMKKNSSTYAECQQKTKCDLEHGIECNPVDINSKDVYKRNRECRCNTFEDYMFGESLEGSVCTSDKSIANHCYHAGPCGNGMERVQSGTCVPKCEQGHRTKYSDECIEDPETTSRSQNPQSTHSNAKAPYTSQSTSPSETVITTDLSSTIQIGTTDKADSDSNTWKAAFIVTLVILLFVVIAFCKRKTIYTACCDRGNPNPRAGGNRGRKSKDDENNAEPERIELAVLREAGGNRGRQGQDDENNAEPEELAGFREAGGNRGRQGQDDENNTEPEELAGLREAGGNRGRQGQDDENNAIPEERIELAGLREEGPVPRLQGQDDRNDALEVQGRTSIETVLNLRKIKTVNLNYYGNGNQTKDEYQKVGSEPTKPPRNQLAEIENEMSNVSDVERELSGAQLDDLAVTVLRKCFTRLLDDLDSMETGDYLYQLEVISRRTNQDISEMLPTKRCRNILDCVARERFKGYKVFTAIIKVTNPQLFEHLKKCETENVTTIKEET